MYVPISKHSLDFPICVYSLQPYRTRSHSNASIWVYILVLIHINRKKKTNNSRHNKKWMAAAGRILVRRWHRMIKLIAANSLFIQRCFVVDICTVQLRLECQSWFHYQMPFCSFCCDFIFHRSILVSVLVECSLYIMLHACVDAVAIQNK